jgi:hypothetical protein
MRSLDDSEVAVHYCFRRPRNLTILPPPRVSRTPHDPYKQTLPARSPRHSFVWLLVPSSLRLSSVRLLISYRARGRRRVWQTCRADFNCKLSA